MKLLFLLGLLFVFANGSFVKIAPSSEFGSVCDVTVFGAIGDGKTYDTNAIQDAVDTCAQGGGGTVVLPAGTYLTATIHLRSHIRFHLESGATLLAGTERQDYHPTDKLRWYALVGEDVTDVAVTGYGTLDGQGNKYIVEHNPDKHVMREWEEEGVCEGECRPKLLGFIDATRVRIENVQLVDPAYWCLQIEDSNDVVVSGITILGDFNIPNTDGIDIEGSSNVHISNCHIDTGDDAICPKTTRGPVSDVVVTSCTLRSKSSAVKLGSGSHFPFKNLVFSDLIIQESHRGLGIQIRDAGDVDDVLFTNIVVQTQYYHPSWWGRGEPIYITVLPRNETDPNHKVGRLRNVRFENIQAISENGVFIAGSVQSPLEGVVLENVQVTIDHWSEYHESQHDYRPISAQLGDPSSENGIVDAPTSGVYIEHVRDITLRDVHVRWGDNKQDTWGMALETLPQTVGRMDIRGLEEDCSA